MLALAREVGFKDARHVSGTLLAERYFADRTDGLRRQAGGSTAGHYLMLFIRAAWSESEGFGMWLPAHGNGRSVR
jgi:hypothetical protein